MKTDPKAGDVFDCVEPQNQGRSGDPWVFGTIILISVLVFVYKMAALVITDGRSVIDAPAASLEKKEGGE